MKVRSVYLTLLTAFVVPVAAAGADRSNQSTAIQTFTGEIMDLLCAGYKGHDYMMQQMKSIGSDKKTCINSRLIQLGAKYVLFDKTQQKAYHIDNPDKVESLAGHAVRISGSSSKRIRLESMTFRQQTSNQLTDLTRVQPCHRDAFN